MPGARQNRGPRQRAQGAGRTAAALAQPQDWWAARAQGKHRHGAGAGAASGLVGRGTGPVRRGVSSGAAGAPARGQGDAVPAARRRGSMARARDRWDARPERPAAQPHGPRTRQRSTGAAPVHRQRELSLARARGQTQPERRRWAQAQPGRRPSPGAGAGRRPSPGTGAGAGPARARALGGRGRWAGVGPLGHCRTRRHRPSLRRAGVRGRCGGEGCRAGAPEGWRAVGFERGVNLQGRGDVVVGGSDVGRVSDRTVRSGDARLISRAPGRPVRPGT